MATLGTTTDPTTQGGGAVGLMVFTAVTATEAGTITAMNIYFDSSSPFGNVKPLIYQDNAGTPGALLATGTPYNFATTLTAGWRSTPISYTFTNGQVLWLASIQDQAGIHTYSRADTGKTSYYKAGQTYASPPDPISSPTADASKSYGFYVTYTPSGGGGTTAKAVAFAPRHPHLFYDSQELLTTMWTFQYASISATGNLSVGPKGTTLVGVTVNTGAASAVLTIYDNTAGSGTKIATIDASATGNFSYFVRCKTGCYAVLSGGNADVTVIYAQMPNPSGQNSPVNFNGFVQNPPVYGDKQKQGDLARTAPVAGAAAAAGALNAPRRSQRQAVRGQQPQTAPQPVPAPQPAPLAPSYHAQLAQAWQEIAAIPGASPLVQALAQEAQVGQS